MITCPNCGTSYPPSVRLCPKDGTVLEGHRPTEERFVGAVLHGKYRLDSYLSSGGMGAVFRATHVMLGKPVAVKLIKADLVTSPDMVRRFQREARAATTLNHPNIVAVYDLGQADDGTLYIAMELVDGKSLKDVIKGGGRVGPRRAVSILRQVASALALAHRHQIVHRDLKPQNVMLTRDSEGREVAKLLDFGIAKTFDEGTNLTQTGFALGTPQYMAPEQAMGKEVDGRSDLYALGVMMYEMLTGEVPFNDPSGPAILIKHMMEAPVPPSRRRPDLEIPAELEAVALKCLEKDPSNRYQTAEELTAALEGASGHVPAAVAVPVSGDEASMVPPPGTEADVPTIAATVQMGAPTQPTIAAQPPPPPGAPAFTPVGAAAAPTPSGAADTKPTVPAVPPPAAAHVASTPARSYAGVAVLAAIILLLGAAGAGALYMMKGGNQPSATAANDTSTPPDAAPATALPPPATTPDPPATDAAAADSPKPVVPAPLPSASPAPDVDPPRGRGGESVEPARPPAENVTPAPPARAAQPPAEKAAAPPPAPAMPENPSVFIDCRGAGEICGAVRSAFDQTLERENMPIARSSDRADIVLVVNVTKQSERHEQHFGQDFVVSVYSMDVTADAPKVDRAPAMGSPRTVSFDARVGRERANEAARAMAIDAVARIRAFVEKVRGQSNP